MEVFLTVAGAGVARTRMKVPVKATSQLAHVQGGGSNGPGGVAGAGASQERLSALLAGVAAGDGGALASLYDETSPFVFGLLRRVLGAGAEAEETLVEVYTCVWRGAAAYRPERASALAWLVSTALECVARRGRAAEGARAAEPFAPSAGPCAGEDGALPSRIDAEAARAREAFRRLEPKQREALQLSYFHGPGRLEAAMGLSSREARALVSVGLKSYAEMFKGAPAGEARKELNGL